LLSSQSPAIAQTRRAYLPWIAFDQPCPLVTAGTSRISNDSQNVYLGPRHWQQQTLGTNVGCGWQTGVWGANILGGR